MLVMHFVRPRWPELLVSMTNVWNTSQTFLQHSMASEARLGALCCRSSPLRAMSIRPPATASSSGRAYTVPRLGRLHQMGRQQLDGCRGTRAALRRVEYPGQGGGGTRAALRRVGFSGQEVGGCSVSVAQWLTADSGAASAFQRMLSARQVPGAIWIVRRPRLRHGVDVKQPLSTVFTMRILVLHLIWSNEMSSEKKHKKERKHRARFGRTPGLK